jgi:hypothetical protein
MHRGQPLASKKAVLRTALHNLAEISWTVGEGARVGEAGPAGQAPPRKNKKTNCLCNHFRFFAVAEAEVAEAIGG